MLERDDKCEERFIVDVFDLITYFCMSLLLFYPRHLFSFSSGKYWRSVHRYSPRLGLSLLEAKRGDSEEAEAVSAMASLSVANTNTMDHR